MHTGNGQITELLLTDGRRYARLSCPENLVPAPGQYLLASNGSDSLLPTPIFYTDSAPQGFICAAPDSWLPGGQLQLRGPLGRGFSLPTGARKVGLVVFDDIALRLRGLVTPALRQDASVVLVCGSASEDLPDEVEVQPLSALDEILKWADYLAFDVLRENLSELIAKLETWRQLPSVKEAQILVRTQMPCGGIAECGVCAVVTRSGWMMACRDGPVFDLREI
jgi:dihydroorotate dehydrogenase electron transfer subunit